MEITVGSITWDAKNDKWYFYEMNKAAREEIQLAEVIEVNINKAKLAITIKTKHKGNETSNN